MPKRSGMRATIASVFAPSSPRPECLIIHLTEFMNIPDTKEIGQYLIEHSELRRKACDANNA